MKNFFETNILPLSDELQNLLDAQELRDDKDRADAQVEVDELTRIRTEQDGCDD